MFLYHSWNEVVTLTYQSHIFQSKFILILLYSGYQIFGLFFFPTEYIWSGCYTMAFEQKKQRFDLDFDIPLKYKIHCGYYFFHIINVTPFKLFDRFFF